MKYLLDSNAASGIIAETPNDLLCGRIDDAGADAVLCAHVLVELRSGAYADPKVKRGRMLLELYEGFRERFKILSFDEAAAIEATDTFARLVNMGNTPTWFDCMVASVAKVHGLTVVTHDADYLAFGIRVEDWTQEDKKLRPRNRKARGPRR